MALPSRPGLTGPRMTGRGTTGTLCPVVEVGFFSTLREGGGMTTTRLIGRSLGLVLLALLGCSPAAERVPDVEAGTSAADARTDLGFANADARIDVGSTPRTEAGTNVADARIDVGVALQVEAGSGGVGGGTDASSAPQTEAGSDGIGGGTDANFAPQIDVGIDGTDAGTDADAESQADAGSDGIAGGRDGGLPCIVSIPAANTGPGAQGEYRVSLTTPIFVVAGRGVPQSLEAGSGASEIVYFDGTDFVDRVLVPPLERRTAANLVGMPGVPAGTSSAMSDLWSNMSDGRVAVLLPFAPPVGFPQSRDLMLLDMVRCEVHPTGFNQVSADTYYATYGLTRGDYAGDLLALSRTHKASFGATVWEIAVTVMDTTTFVSWPDRMVPVFNWSATLPATTQVALMPLPSPAVSDEVIAFTRMAAGPYGNCEIFWLTFAAVSGTIPQVACTQAIVADAGRIAWSDGHVWLFDTGAGTLLQLTTQSSRQQNPSLRGRLVAYEDDRGGDLDIYALDITTGVESPVFVGPGDQHLLGILRDGIVWWSATADGIGVFWNPTFTPATTAAQ